MSTNPSHRSQLPAPGTPGSPTYAQVVASPPHSPSAAGSKRVRKPTKHFDGTYAPPIKKTKTTDDTSTPIQSASTPAPAAASAPTRAPPRARPTLAKGHDDESSEGSESDSEGEGFLPGSGSDRNSDVSGLDLDTVLSGDDSVVEAAAVGRSKEKSKERKKKKSKGKKKNGKAKAQLRAAVAAVPDAEKEPEKDEAELGVYPKITYCVLVLTSPS
jgi:hypothetical protein